MSTTTFRNVALLGVSQLSSAFCLVTHMCFQATGNLGSHILKVLTSAGFSVTAIQRADSKNVAAEATNSLKIDLSSESALAAAFKGQDVVISAVPNPKLSSEKVWMNAAISAGVKRIVPSEFSSNIEMEASRKLPIVKGKLEIRAYVEEIASAGRIEWTSINNGPFFVPWIWVVGVWGPNFNNRTVTYHDGGHKIVCTTTLHRIAEAVAQVLKPEHMEATRNKPIYIYSAPMSERKMHDVVKRITGIEFEEVHVSIDAVVKETQEAMRKGDTSKMMNFYLPFCFGEGYGGDFRDIASNETLKLKEMSDEELEEGVKMLLKEVGVPSKP